MTARVIAALAALAVSLSPGVVSAKALPSAAGRATVKQSRRAVKKTPVNVDTSKQKAMDLSEYKKLVTERDRMAETLARMNAVDGYVIGWVLGEKTARRVEEIALLYAGCVRNVTITTEKARNLKLDDHDRKELERNVALAKRLADEFGAIGEDYTDAVDRLR